MNTVETNRKKVSPKKKKYKELNVNLRTEKYKN